MNPERRAFQTSEQTNLQQQQQHQNAMQSTPGSITVSLLPSFPATANNGNPPPVPVRPPTSSYQSTMPGMSSMFGYGGGMNGMYGMNQNYGYGGGFMPPFAATALSAPMGLSAGIPQGSVFHDVEDVGRSVFETVGSVVQTLGSVSVMLQSTLFAMQNSVQAVVSVANQFGHLRSRLIDMCISAIRIVRYYYRKLLNLFRLDRRAGVERLWDEAAHHATTCSSLNGADNGRGSIILFFAVVIGTPYLLWSLIKSVIAQSNPLHQWKRGNGEHFVGKASYTYKAVNSDELSITCGDTIYIAPKHKQPTIKGWLLAAINGRTGLVPANYIKIEGKSNNNSSGKMDSNIEEVEEDKKELLTDVKTTAVPDEMTVPEEEKAELSST